MTKPFDYFKEAITTKYFQFHGRARRAEYWYFQLFTFLCLIPIYIIIAIAISFFNEGEDMLFIIFPILFLLAVLFIMIPSLAVTVRRFHDVGQSGWIYLIGIIPFGSFYILYLCLKEGDKETNRFGEDPKGDNLELKEFLDK